MNWNYVKSIDYITINFITNLYLKQKKDLNFTQKKSNTKFIFYFLFSRTKSNFKLYFYKPKNYVKLKYKIILLLFWQKADLLL